GYRPAGRRACGWRTPACGRRAAHRPGPGLARAGPGGVPQAAVRRSYKEAATASVRAPSPPTAPRPAPDQLRRGRADAGGNGASAWAAKRSAVLLAQQLLQGRQVEQTNFTLIDADRTFACKS